MFSSQTQEMIDVERRREMSDAAEQYRLFKLAIGNQKAPALHLAYSILAKLGGWMVAWGSRLQSRYEDVIITAPAAPAPPASVKPC